MACMTGALLSLLGTEWKFLDNNVCAIHNFTKESVSIAKSSWTSENPDALHPTVISDQAGDGFRADDRLQYATDARC